MPDLTREDLAAFVALWPRMHVSVAAVTESTLTVLRALRELAAEGGTLTVWFGAPVTALAVESSCARHAGVPTGQPCSDCLLERITELENGLRDLAARAASQTAVCEGCSSIVTACDQLVDLDVRTAPATAETPLLEDDFGVVAGDGL